MDNGSRCLQQAWDERPEFVAEVQQPWKPILQVAEQFLGPPCPTRIVGRVVRTEEFQSRTRIPPAVRGMKPPDPSRRPHRRIRVAGVAARDAAFQVLDDQPRNSSGSVAIDTVESGGRHAQRSQDVPIDAGLVPHVTSVAIDALERPRPVFDEDAQRGSVPADMAGHDLRRGGALVRVRLTTEYGDALVGSAVRAKDGREPGCKSSLIRELGTRPIWLQSAPPSTRARLQSAGPAAVRLPRLDSTSSVIRLIPPGSSMRIELHVRGVLCRAA